FYCNGCAYPFQVPDSMAGQKGRCPRCDTINAIPLRSAPVLLPLQQPAPAPPARPAGAPRPAPRRRERPSAFVPLFLPFLVVALIGGGVAWWWWTSSTSLGSEMNYLPDDVALVASVRVDQGLNSKALKELRAELPDLDKMLTTDEWSRSTLGVSLSRI